MADVIFKHPSGATVSLEGNAELAQALRAQENPFTALADAGFVVAKRTCNRHDDCDAADKRAKEGGFLYADHCHDEYCEDCFGY